MSYPPEQTVIDRRRTVVLTEAGPFERRPAPDAMVDTRAIEGATAEMPERIALRDLPWLVPVALVLIVALVVAGVALTLSDGSAPSSNDVSGLASSTRPADRLDAPPVAPNAELTIGTAESFTSTIRVGGGEDLSSTLVTNPGPGSRLGGAPVNGDAVVVQQVFGVDAFSVSPSSSSAPVLVYLPSATDELVGFVPGVTRVLFVGTLHPAPADLGAFLGSGPASIAARNGVYVVAVPETVVRVSPPSA